MAAGGRNSKINRKIKYRKFNENSEENEWQEVLNNASFDSLGTPVFKQAKGLSKAENF